MAAQIFLLVIISILWFVFYYRQREFRKFTAAFPKYPYTYPIVGSLQILFIRNFQRYLLVLRDISKQCHAEGLVSFWLGPSFLIFINDPKYLKALAINTYKKGIMYQVLFGTWANGAFLTDDVGKWKELRKPLNKLVTKKIIDNDHHEIMIKRTRDFIDFIKERRYGKEFNVINDVKNYAFDIFVETQLGVKTSAVEESKTSFSDYVIRYMEENLERGITPIISNFFRNTNDSHIETLKTPKEFLMKVLEERSQEPSAFEGEIKYYTDFLLRRMKEKNIQTEEIIRELIDFSMAGVDTSPSAGANALAFLAVYPEIQDEAYQEQVGIFGDDLGRNPTPQDVSEMVLLNRIFKESLRFSCPEFIFKQAEENIKLDDKYTIPKGTVCILHLGSISTDERYWEKPMEFNPDHFLPENEAKRVPYAYTPFGIGPRSCPGLHYAKRSVLLLLSFIIRNYKLSTKMKRQDIIIQQRIMREIVNCKIEFIKR